MKYNVIHPIEHDNRRYADGQIELSAEDAEPLLKLKHIAKPEKKASGNEGTDKPEGPSA